MAQYPKKRTYSGPARIGRQVPDLMKKAYERFGFAYGQVLSHWPEIIGEGLADFTQPERIRWPRRAAGQSADARKSGGTLVIKVDGPVAIEIQHSIPQIMDRINGYYGYSAITDIKIIQGPVTRRERRRAPVQPILDPDSERALDDRVAEITDPRLKATLSQLGRNIMFSKK